MSPRLYISSRTVLSSLTVLLFLSAWVGIRGLNADSFWLDEIWTVRQAHLATPLDVWSQISAHDPWQAPGYFMAVQVWGGLAGWSELAIRFLSLLAGLLGIAFTYRLAREFTNRQGALAAAVLLGASAYFLYFFHEARAYTLYVLLTPMMVWAYRRFAISAGGGYAFLLACAMVGALYVHYFAALTVVLLGLFHFSAGLRWFGLTRRWWLLTAVFGVCFLLFIPWLSVLVNGIAQAGRETAVRGANALSSADMIRGTLFLFSNGSTALLVLALFFVLQSGRRVVAIWAWAFGLLVMLMVINAILGVILEIRYMFALWPVLALLGGIGLRYLSQDRAAVYGVFLGIWVAAGLWMTFSPDAAVALRNPHWYLPWREWKSVLESRSQPGDAVLVALPDWTWPVYHKDSLDYYLGGLALEESLIAQPDHVPGEDYSAQFQLGADIQRVWVTYDPSQPTNHMERVRQELSDRGFVGCSVFPSGPPDTMLFARAPGDDVQPSAVFGPESTVRAFEVEGSSMTFPVLIWMGSDLQDVSGLSAGIYLDSPDAGVVAQADAGLPADSPACLAYILSPAQEEAALRQTLAVYAWETGERLPVIVAPQGVLEDGRAVLRDEREGP